MIDTTALTDRLDRLEAEVRSLRGGRSRYRLAIVLMSLPVAAIFLGAAAQEKAKDGAQASPKRIELRDEAGKVRVTLSAEGGVGRLQLHNDEGFPAIDLGTKDRFQPEIGPVIRCFGANPLYAFGGADGKFWVYMGKNAGTGVPYLELRDERGDRIIGWGGSAINRKK